MVKATCPTCSKEFKDVAKHTCLAGECPHCRTILKNVKKHSCPVVKFNQVVDSVLDELKPKGSCAACGSEFFGGRFLKHAIGEKRYCRTCWFRPEHQAVYQAQKQALEAQVREFLVAEGKTGCTLCHEKLVELHRTVVYYEFDHVDVGEKDFNVGKAIMQLLPAAEIFTELKKCRLLCDSCHDVTTAVQKNSGVHDIRRELLVADRQLSQRVSSNVERWSRALIRKRKRNSEEQPLLEQDSLQRFAAPSPPATSQQLGAELLTAVTGPNTPSC